MGRIASHERSPEPPGPAALKARQLRQRWAGPRRLGWVALNGLDATEEGREMEMKNLAAPPEFQPQGLAGGHF
jgi:hypothetical protein